MTQGLATQGFEQMKQIIHRKPSDNSQMHDPRTRRSMEHVQGAQQQRDAENRRY
jgi:hypothetical protein